MEKIQLMEILQSCLLNFEGTPESELYSYMNPTNVKIGIKLCKFLENKLKEEIPILSVQEERQVQYWDSRCKDTGGIEGCPSPKEMNEWVKANPKKSNIELWHEFVSPRVEAYKKLKQQGVLQ